MLNVWIVKLTLLVLCVWIVSKMGIIRVIESISEKEWEGVVIVVIPRLGKWKVFVLGIRGRLRMWRCCKKR